MELKIIRSGTNLPKPATEVSAGYDLQAMFDENQIVLLPNEDYDIPTGIAINMTSRNKSGMHFSRIGAFLFPRSGIGSRGLTLRNTVGLIDEDYQGEIIAKVTNRGKGNLIISRGDRIVQLVMIPVVIEQFNIVSKFSNETERGTGGFSSTGQ